jgi:hypothetical protein
MTVRKRVGFIIWGKAEQDRNVFTDEKYKGLAEYFDQRDLAVTSIVYNNRMAESLREQILQLDALLVWVNPIEDGDTREVLDQLLEDAIARGVAVNTQPKTILKIGTKRVLYETRDLPWGSDVRLYERLVDFKASFAASLAQSGTRVLKQYRGDGGTGIYKVSMHNDASSPILVLHAKRGSVEERMTLDALYEKIAPFFDNGRPLIDQAWNDNLANGMVRCYLSGTRVAGFGYQEINALYPSTGEQVQPGKRYYYTENCGLFYDLKHLMETSWVNLLTTRANLNEHELPVIWDCDFFINDVNGLNLQQPKYTLGEINVSCVSPFPESAIPHIYDEVKQRL